MSQLKRFLASKPELRRMVIQEGLGNLCGWRRGRAHIYSDLGGNLMLNKAEYRQWMQARGVNNADGH